MNKIHVVEFTSGTTAKTITGLFQWNFGQILQIKGLDLPSAVEVHFALRRSGEAIRRIGVTKDGVTEVEIPDVLFKTMMTSDYDIYAYVYVSDEEYGSTTHEIVMKVKSRPMPEDIQNNFDELMKAVNALADGKVDKNQGTENNGKFLGVVDGYLVLVDAPSGTSGTTDVVRCVAQELTEEQQEQVRANIGAASMTEFSALSEEIEDLKQNGTTGGGTVVSSIEPMEDDIPKVFFTGTTPTTKAEDELPLTMEYVSKSKRFFSYVTLKVQGDSSASYPQKNFNMKMFSDEARTEKLKTKFRNWTFSTHKYCLKKNWIDVLHARNVVNGRLWNEVVKSRSDYESYPIEYRESSNSGAVDGFPVKVYVNGVYQGLYTWNIRKDESMFNMDDETGTHSALIADGSNDITLWRALPNIDGTDWTDELNDIVPDAIKTGFRNAYNFVMTATDDEFKNNIEQYFYKSSLIDYYVFIYAIQMVGGLAKSQTMFTYDAQKFLANIYDMDTTWALMWSGADFYPTNMTCPDGYMTITGQEKSNLLYERIVNGFTDEMRERYFELRSGILSNANVINHFERFTDSIVSANLYSEEYASTTAGSVATNRPSKSTNTIQKMRQCIVERLAYCDEQFALLKAPVKATGITLSASTLSFDEKVSQTLTATLEPSDTTDVVIWTSSDNSVATVSDGVVTPVSNGNATIRATAGNVYAECSVMVQYTDYSCTGITLSTNTLTFNEKGTQTLVATVTPTNTTDEIIWASDDETIATVNNGVVTAKWNGTTIIRVTCGNYSAECTVTVSGIEATPLDDAVLYNGYVYDATNGEMKAQNQCFATSKFRLEEANYTITVAQGRNVTVYVWDENSNFVGRAKHANTSADGTNPTNFYVLAKPNYIYALSWWNTLVETDTIDSVTITKTAITTPDEQQSWTISEMTFAEASGVGSYAEMTGATFDHLYKDVAKASHLVFAECMGQLIYSYFKAESGIFVINWRNISGYKPCLFFDDTTDNANAYFAENNVVLTFN